MIIVIGSINLDLVTKVERLPAPGETVPGTAFSTSPGGKGANQALAARRAGAKVRLIGAVGRDAFAEEALSIMEAAGVDLSGVRRAAASTGTALIMVGTNGENMIAIVPGANNSVLRGDLSAAAICQGEYVLLQHEIPLETVEAALDAANGCSATAILNTAPFCSEAAPLLAKAAIVVANETEFDLYAKVLGLEGASRPDRMRAFVAATGRTIIVTLGAMGVDVVTPDASFAVSAIEVEAVDTVGAGDTFCGYLAASLGAGMLLEDAVRRAAVAGSLACRSAGAQPSIPMAAEVDKAL